MKKTKILLASVAVASLAAGCAVFAACGDSSDGGDPGYNVTFDANGGSYGEQTSVTLRTGENGKLTALPENDPTYAEHEFDGYNTASDGSGSKVTVDKEYTTTTTVYAQWSNIYTVTFVTGTEGALETGAATTAKTTKGKLASLPAVTVTAEKKSFLGWYTTASGEGDEITVDYVFSGDTLAVNAYARYRDEYTVTLSAGADGTIATGTTVTYVTKNGKIDGYLPADEAVTCTKENFHFGGWVDGENDVDEREYVFEKDTTLTAKYVQDNGLWNQDGTAMLASLVLNAGATDHTEYWFGPGTSYEFTQGTVITVYLDGKKQENFWLTGSCVDLSEDVNNYGGITTSEATVTEDASFQVYIKLYPNGGTTYEFNGTPTRLPETNEIPAGADAITITVKDPDAGEGADALGTLTLHIIGKDGKSVKLNPEEGYDSAAIYQIHAWSGSDINLFGEWGDNPTLDTNPVLNYANYNKKVTTFKFHEKNGSWQSGNFSGMELNGTYVINLQDGTVKAYVAPTPEV